MATLGNNILIGTMSGSTFTPFAAVKSHDIDTLCELIEKSSSTQQEWKEYITGRKEWTVNVSYLVLQDANSNIEDMLKVGRAYAIRIKGRSGNYKLSGNVICQHCKQSYQVGSIAYGSYVLKGNGVLTNT